MKRLIGFEHGMGIGGWLTNYKRFHVLPENRRKDITIGDLEHFATYITEADVSYIASLGMDHIRLGFDQIVVEEAPGVFRETVMERIDAFVSWCEVHDLNVVLNLHKAVGNYCDIHEDVHLLDDEGLQAGFVDLWCRFEERYAGKPGVAFELLNEVVDVDPAKWNTLVDKAVTALRAKNATRKLIIGSTCWNNVDRLKHLHIYDDDNIIYTFHMYAPFEFTHQRGVLQANTLYYNRIMPYPCEIERYRDYARTVCGAKEPYSGYERMDERFVRNCLYPATVFLKEHPNAILWCGEFGTIRHADIRWRENYMRDVIRFLKDYEIPYCVWNYLSTPNDGNRFSLVDDDNRRILSEEMARIIRGEV